LKKKYFNFVVGDGDIGMPIGNLIRSLEHLLCIDDDVTEKRQKQPQNVGLHLE